MPCFGVMAKTAKYPTPAELIQKMKKTRDEEQKLPKVAFFDLTDHVVERPASFSLFGDNQQTLQSLIDQFKEIQGIKYIYIVNEEGEILAHTFVPGIPKEIMASNRLNTGAG